MVLAMQFYLRTKKVPFSKFCSFAPGTDTQYGEHGSIDDKIVMRRLAFTIRQDSLS